MKKTNRAMIYESAAYKFLCSEDTIIITERWMSGELLRHEWLQKCELIKDQILEELKDPHREMSGAV